VNSLIKRFLRRLLFTHY